MIYMAKSSDGNTAVILGRDILMDKYLDRNYSIYQKETMESEEVLIATPEQGFLIERPVFPIKHTVSLRRSE